MGLFYYSSIRDYQYLLHSNKLSELISKKELKKNEYKENPIPILYFEILNLKKQINTVKLKYKKKSKSKLRYELINV